jgi:hypothetical protein
MNKVTLIADIEKDIEIINEKVGQLKSAGQANSAYQPQAVRMAIAELLKAKAQLIQCYLMITEDKGPKITHKFRW